MKRPADASQASRRHLLVLPKEGSPPCCAFGEDRDCAIIGSQIKLDTRILHSYSFERWSNVHEDLLVLCASIEYADRRWTRSTRWWERKFHLTVPVLELGVWRSSRVQAALREALNHLTGDDWQFEFGPNEAGPILRAGQAPLFPNEDKEFVVAYSDGTDSLCATALHRDRQEAAVRLRVSSGKENRREQPNLFDRLPFQVGLGNRNRENTQRSRGFKFAAITALAANLSGVNEILVPESGQGALGPVLLRLHNVYSDYRNHPMFFRRMERFVNTLLDTEITYVQPRLWHTKGQTIREFSDKFGSDAEHLLSTRSCWQNRWNVRFGGELNQCGICAACLLRRMSFHAAGIDEPIERYGIGDLGKSEYMDARNPDPGFKPTKTLHRLGIAGTMHLEELALLASRPTASLRSHALDLTDSLSLPMEEVESLLRGMLTQHAIEWNNFKESLGDQSFLHNWTIQMQRDAFSSPTPVRRMAGSRHG